MRAFLTIVCLNAVFTHGQKCGMAMQVHREDLGEQSNADIFTPKDQANMLLESIKTPLTLDYIRCEGDDGVCSFFPDHRCVLMIGFKSCLVRLDVEKLHAQGLKEEIDRKKGKNVEATDAVSPKIEVNRNSLLRS